MEPKGIYTVNESPQWGVYEQNESSLQPHVLCI
jgi:hypothetical protein